MTLDELRDEYRRRADDTVEPYKTSDPDLARFATEGEREACVRGSLIYDNDSTLTTFDVVASQETVDVSAEIDRIDSATFTPSTGGLAQDMDLTGIDAIREFCDWQTRTCSRPYKLAHLSRGKLRLWPTPSVAGTLQLAVYRYPLLAMEDAEDEPEIGVEHHDGLVDWMLYRGLQPKDGEEGDPQRAEQALADFTERFGERPDADTQRRRRERRRITTRPI
jgi:hypothetical protein